MKRSTALLLVLCLLLISCFAFAETESAEPEQQELTLHDIRYYFEHRLLPGELHSNADQLLTFLREHGLFTLWQNFTLNNGLDVFFTEEDFSVTELPQENGDTLLMLTLPKPEETPLCARVYLYRSAETGETGYYTVEYDNFMGEAWFLCSWTKDGTHMNHGGAAPLPDPAEPGYEAALAEEVNAVLQLAAA